MTNPSYRAQMIEEDLLALKSKLEEWAEQIKKPASRTNSADNDIRVTADNHTH
jgi:hypothetical protein